MQVLEEKCVPSASPENAQAIGVEASPPAASSAAAFISHVESTLDQVNRVIGTIQHDAIGVVQTVDQRIVQGLSFVWLQWNRLRGIDLNASNPSQPAASQTGNDWGAGRGNSSGSGSGKGTLTTSQNGSSQVLNSSTQRSGRGSGSGSGTTNHITVSKQGFSNGHLQPGSGSAGSNGSGTGFIGNGTGSGPANVYGQVWLDNNGDGSINNGEMGFQGITVELINPSTGYVYQSQLTKAGGGYSFTITEPPPPGHTYAVQVILSSVPYRDFYATLRGPGVSQINAHGTSASFNVANGGWRQIEAGICSMDVTTTNDDPNEVVDPNQVTLRDAIETGNNGGGLNQLSNEEPVRFIDPLNGDSLTGTITLQAVLPAIEKSYDIDGPGVSTLTVNGNNNAGTIFTVNAGVTSTISGLTITGGSGTNGGGINNNGNLKLNSDIIKGNTTSGKGGAIYNGKWSVTLSGDQILGNTTASGGGLYNDGGTVTLTGSTVIKNNKATTGLGGGINNASGTVTVSGGSVINSNATAASGGGVANQGTFLMTGGQINNNYMLPGPNSGGGVFNQGSMGLKGVQIQGNSAVTGGGIYQDIGTLVLRNNTTISGNKASSNGAGMYVYGGTAAMLGGGITSNTAQDSGGGIYVQSGELWLQNGVLVLDNKAVGNGGGGYGGGVYISGGTVTVTGGTMSFNTAGGFSGGGIYNWGGTLTLKESVNITSNSAIKQGGGIYLAGPLSTTTFNGVTVSGNSTSGDQKTTGWGVYWQNRASVIGLPNGLTDKDDPNGNPVPGP